MDKMMKCWVAILLLCMSATGAMAQKNIDRIVEELEKSDEAAVNSVTKRNPSTRKIVRMVKTFSLTDMKMAKRLIAAFEKDEEYAVSAIKDMPKGRKTGMKVNFTFIFQQDNEKRIYSLTTDENGQINLSVNMRKDDAEGGNVALYLDNDMTQWQWTKDWEQWTKDWEQWTKDWEKTTKNWNKKLDNLGCVVSNSIKFDKKNKQLVLEGDVWVNGKKMKKGTYTMNGQKVIVR